MLLSKSNVIREFPFRLFIAPQEELLSFWEFKNFKMNCISFFVCKIRVNLSNVLHSIQQHRKILMINSHYTAPGLGTGQEMGLETDAEMLTLV